MPRVTIICLSRDVRVKEIPPFIPPKNRWHCDELNVSGLSLIPTRRISNNQPTSYDRKTEHILPNYMAERSSLGLKITAVVWATQML